MLLVYWMKAWGLPVGWLCCCLLHRTTKCLQHEARKSGNSNFLLAMARWSIHAASLDWQFTWVRNWPPQRDVGLRLSKNEWRLKRHRPSCVGGMSMGGIPETRHYRDRYICRYFAAAGCFFIFYFLKKSLSRTESESSQPAVQSPFWVLQYTKKPRKEKFETRWVSMRHLYYFTVSLLPVDCRGKMSEWTQQGGSPVTLQQNNAHLKPHSCVFWHICDVSESWQGW